MYFPVIVRYTGISEQRAASDLLRMGNVICRDKGNVHLLCTVCGSRCGDSQPVGGVVWCCLSVQTAPVFELRPFVGADGSAQPDAHADGR